MSRINNNNELVSNVRIEDKFAQALENVTEKSSQTRTEALHAMCEILMQRYMPAFVEDRKDTIIDCIEKSITCGKGAEQECGARLASLLVLQLGGDAIVAKALNQFL